MKERLSQGFLAVEKRTRGNPLRKLLGRSIRRFSPGFVGAWEWYINRAHLAKVKILGRSMYLDLRDKSLARPLYEQGVHEPAETDFLAKALRPGMTFIDIGANIGYYTLLGAAAVGKEGRVIAFEPEPHNREILRKNVALNRFTNVAIENKAISDRAGPAEIFLSEDKYGDHRIYRVEEARPSISIESTTLDDYVGQRGLRVDVIKMDIQGAEFAALQGMRKTLTGNSDIILVTEFWPLGLTAFGVKPEDFLHELTQLGFRIYELTDCAGLEATTAERLGDKGKAMQGYDHTDLVMSRQELSTGEKIGNLNLFEWKIYSEGGEDGIIEIIFHTIGTTNKFFVEFGVEDGQECNTRYLLEKRGWHGLMMDCRDNNPPFIKKEFVTAENVNDLFAKYGVPQEFDLLSIDIDSNDYWIWRAIKDYSPRVVAIEYNSSYPPTESKVMAYAPQHRWDGTNYFGASLPALVKLAKAKGYTLVGCDSRGVNAFFVRNDLMEGHFEIREIEELFKPPKYGKRVKGVYRGHPPSDKIMITI